MTRIVSLLPAATEIVCALGLGSQLVGRSHECDLPPSVQALPSCTQTLLDPSAPSAQTDATVRDHRSKAPSLYRVDVAQLRALRPDLVLTQTRCDACAVSLAEVEAGLKEALGPETAVVDLRATDLDGIHEDIRRVAAATGAQDQGARAIDRIRTRVGHVEEVVHHLYARPTVTCLEWLGPLMSSGSWVPTLVIRATGRNLFGTAGRPAASLSWEELRSGDPDTMVLMPCGHDLKRTIRDSEGLPNQRGWYKLRSVRQGRVFAVDGNRHFDRPGPRIAESLEILHPSVCDFGHKGTGWQHLWTVVAEGAALP